MTRNTREYVMPLNVYQRLKMNNLERNCEKCGKPIEIGQVVISVRGKNNAKRRHKECHIHY